MKNKFQLTITHLYPQEMNLYGDLGNITTLRRRANLRGIEVKLVDVGVGHELQPGQTDLYFFGGGQDKQQVQIAEDIIKLKKNALLEDLENEVAALAICGGYQLLGRYYLAANGERAEGIGFFPIETVAPGPDVKQRCIGNISTHLVHDQTIQQVKKYYDYKSQEVNIELLLTLVGFENHGGRTRLLTDENLHLSKVIKGIGDSEDQGFEGLRYKNAFGSYMHGSFLPKNPHVADLLISLALERKYGNEFKALENLDDKLDWKAHRKALKLI